MGTLTSHTKYCEMGPKVDHPYLRRLHEKGHLDITINNSTLHV